MTRQQAFDMAGNGFQHAHSLNNSQNIWLSPNNSFESNSSKASPSLQRARQQQWVKQQSSVNSSNYSNGEVKSFATTSRSRRSSEHKDKHRFSLIPQVSAYPCIVLIFNKMHLFSLSFSSLGSFTGHWSARLQVRVTHSSKWRRTMRRLQKVQIPQVHRSALLPNQSNLGLDNFDSSHLYCNLYSILCCLLAQWKHHPSKWVSRLHS